MTTAEQKRHRQRLRRRAYLAVTGRLAEAHQVTKELAALRSARVRESWKRRQREGRNRGAYGSTIAVLESRSTLSR